MIIEEFIKAFNEKDIDSLCKLLDENIVAISSSGNQFSGRSKVCDIYKKLMKEFGDNARYQLGLYGKKKVVIIKHKIKNKWVVDSIKFLNVRRNLIEKIQSTRDPKIHKDVY